MKLKLAVSMCIACGLISPAAFATNGYFSHGYGMKAKGMGGAGVALPQDALAAATNPAGMVMVGDRADIGLDWFRPSREAQITGNMFPGVNGTYSANGKQNFFIPEFGYNKMLNSDTALGLSVFGNGGMNTTYNTNPFGGFGGTGTAGVNLEQLFISPTWSMKLAPEHSIGVALNLAYQTFEAKGIQPFAGMSQSPANVSNNGKNSSTGYGLRIGWVGQLTPEFSLGATYQTKTRMSKFSKYQGLFAEQGGFDIPANYAIGMALKASPSTTLAFDVERILYGNIKSISNTMAAGGPMGASNGSGFGWRSINVYKLGISHVVDSTLTLRAGYNHNDQPIPASQTFFNILAPGVVQDHLTLGATWTLADKSEITLAYMHAFKKTVSGAGSIPPGAPPGFGGGEANLSMSQNSFGIAYGW
ncbi:MAG: outer membrane protein transport protein [Pseudomonadota bacterium]